MDKATDLALYAKFVGQMYKIKKRLFPSLSKDRIRQKIRKDWKRMKSPQKIALYQDYIKQGIIIRGQDQEFIKQSRKDTNGRVNQEKIILNDANIEKLEEKSDRQHHQQVRLELTEAEEDECRQYKLEWHESFTYYKQQKPKRQSNLPQNEQDHDKSNKKDEESSNLSEEIAIGKRQILNRPEKKRNDKKNLYIEFYLYYYKKIHKMHPHIHAKDVTSVITSLWKKRRQLIVQERRKRRQILNTKPQRYLSARQYYIKTKIGEGYIKREIEEMWKRLPLESKMLWKNRRNSFDPDHEIKKLQLLKEHSFFTTCEPSNFLLQQKYIGFEEELNKLLPHLKTDQSVPPIK